jgi:hypothetical protein
MEGLYHFTGQRTIAKTCTTAPWLGERPWPVGASSANYLARIYFSDSTHEWAFSLNGTIGHATSGKFHPLTLLSRRFD